jgi:lipoprotein NlpI
MLKDYNGAITDFTKAIEIDPNNALAYNNRGIAKYYNKDLKGACEDGKKSASLGSDAYQLIQAACN